MEDVVSCLIGGGVHVCEYVRVDRGAYPTGASGSRKLAPGAVLTCSLYIKAESLT